MAPSDPRPGNVAEWIDLDLREAARAGQLAPAFEVDHHIRLLEDLLTVTPARSPILTGPSGVGKTAIVHELIRRAVSGDGLAMLRDHPVVQLSLRNLAANFKDKEKAADFARQLFDRFAADRTIVFVRDVHVAYALDWEPILYRYLCNSGLPLLGEGYAGAVDQLLEYSSDLAERMVPIPVDEPRPEAVFRIVERWCDEQQARTGRGITADAQRLAVELTGRFLGDRPFPRKVLELLARARDLAAPTEGETTTIGPRDVVARFTERTRVPAHLVDPDVPLDLAGFRAFLEERLLGQEEAIDAVVRVVALLKAGLSTIGRPLGVFLFVGPTGVGKTHTAQLLAEYLFGDRNRMIRINLTDYGGDNGPALLIGTPFGNEQQQQGVLARRLRGHSFGVLLLDELEKASPAVHDALMQLFDEGRFINGAGETISVQSLILIATSNAGAEVFRETGLGFRPPPDHDALDAELDRRLHRLFKVELLNRFDRVVHFHPLDRTHIRAIAHRELTGLARREGVVNRGLALEIEPEVVEWLAAHGYHPHYGARFLRRELERHVTAAVADAIVREQPARGARLQLGVQGNRATVRVLQPVEPVATVRLPDAPRPRALDRRALLEAAREWIARFDAMEREHAERREQASALTERAAAPGFWDEPDQAEAVLRRFKALDARLQADERLLAPARGLRERLESAAPPLDELARRVEAVADAWRQWVDLGSAEGPDAVWVVVRASDPLAPDAALVADLVALYRGWFPRRHLAVDVVAEQEGPGGAVAAAVLEVEGPAAWKVTTMEAGRHRRRTPAGDVERVRVEVLPQRDEGPPNLRIADARRVRGRLLERRAVRLRLDAPARGLSETWFGADRTVLARVAGDLQASLAAPPTEAPVARTYALTGGVVQDPRTGAVHPSVRDVLRGDLDVFWEAWKTR